MNPRPGCRCSSVPAFTLIELLVVIAIIGILAALLLPIVVSMKTKAKVGMAKLQIRNIENDLAKYEATYSQWPVSSSAQAAAAVPANAGTFTFGGNFTDASGASFLIGTPGYTANNSEVMGVLLDMEKFNNGTPTINIGHVKNSKNEQYLQEQRVLGTDPSGIGDDGVYRDPWGSPYIISLNLQRDSHCADAFYKLKDVSQTTPGSSFGLNGLANNSGSADSDVFERAGKMMVWSAGPDKRADPTVKANVGVNKDNVIGWR